MTVRPRHQEFKAISRFETHGRRSQAAFRQGLHSIMNALDSPGNPADDRFSGPDIDPARQIRLIQQNVPQSDDLRERTNRRMSCGTAIAAIPRT